MNKRLSLCLTTAFVMLWTMFSNFSFAEDKYGHVLVSLWDEYYAYENADRVRSASAVLEKICAEAEEKHLPWDFYDGWVKYVSCRCSINWKDGSKVESDFDKAVARLDEPIVLFMRKTQKRIYSHKDFMDNYAVRLSSSRNAAFYLKQFLPSDMGGELPKYIRNDKEFVLWNRFLNEGCRDSGELKKEIGDVYPAACYADFLAARQFITRERYNQKDLNKGESMLKAVAAKCPGSAIAYLVQCELLELEKYNLDRDNGSSRDYKQLRSKALALSKEKSRFPGSERAIVLNADNAKRMVETLDSKSLNVYVKDDHYVVQFRNLSSCTLTVSSEGGKPIHTINVDNPQASYYKTDMVEVDIPRMDDGQYSVAVKNGQFDNRVDYVSYSISISMQKDSEGYALYAADSRTGKPVEKVNVVLDFDGKQLYSGAVSSSSGIMRLPEAFASQYKKSVGKNLSCSYVDADGFMKKSPNLYIYDDVRLGKCAQSEDEILLYTDRGAYNAGDTVYFKAILCNGVADKYKTLADKEIEFNIYDVDNAVQGTIKVTTNEFGSASGKFVIAEGLKNGWFELRASWKEAEAARHFLVGDFQIPTYEVKVDPQDKFYIAGDTVHIGGFVKSYSGHSLSGATLEWKVRGKDLQKGILTVKSDGRFDFSFPTDANLSWSLTYVVDLKLVSPTGEVLESRSSVSVKSGLYCFVDLVSELDPVMETGSYAYSIGGMLIGSSAHFEVRRDDLADYPVSWKLYSIGKDVRDIAKYCAGRAALASGVVSEGDKLDIDMSGHPSGIYALIYEAEVSRPDGRVKKCSREYVFACLKSEPEALPAGFPTFMVTSGSSENDDFSLLLGNVKGARWVLVQLHDAKCRPVFSKVIKFADANVEKIDFQYLPEWTDEMQLNCCYFFDSSCHRLDRHFRRTRSSEFSIPVDFTRFFDTTSPLSRYEYSFKTDPGAECLVSVYDEAVDKIKRARWWPWSRRGSEFVGLYMRYACGGSSLPLPKTRSLKNAMFSADGAMSDLAYSEGVAAAAPEFESDGDDVIVREDFARTLCFHPHLRPSGDGTVTFPVPTSGTLSTFNVKVLAHTPDMRMGWIQKQMRVTVPVKVEVLAPQYLYAGDKCVIPVNLSSVSADAVSGVLTVYVYDTDDYKAAKPVSVASVEVAIPAGDAVKVVPSVEIPSDCGKVGLKYVFKASDRNGGSSSDAVFVSFPVYSEYQTITEAHSCIVMPGEDKKHMADSLSAAFVNVSAYGSVQDEKRIIQMLAEAIPGSVETDASDVLSLTSALYIYEMASMVAADNPGIKVRKPEDLESKIELCHNSDGGYSWFPGMKSSAVVTSIVLERYGELKSRGVKVPSMDAAVKYLDRTFHDPMHFSWVNMQQYLYVRSMWACVPMTENVSKDVRKSISGYLVPSAKAGRGMNGYILGKARRLRTLLLLSKDLDGQALASSLGLSWKSVSQVAASASADAVSLMEYAVHHGRGVWYYPNAVMPFRGLLENEAYAHALLCHLMDDVARPDNNAAEIARGIRIWLMMQKETQEWKTGTGYLDAISAVLEDAANLADVCLLTVSKTYRKPFNEIRAEGNEMSVDRKFYREVSGTMVEIHEGDEVKVGDVIYGVYEIWSKENRSFVRVSAPRESALHPADQISGYSGFMPRPLFSNVYSFSAPAYYRDVRKERTDYYLEVCPEEKSVLMEQFHVQRAGTFTAPVTTIDCLYASHYRATAGFAAPLAVQ